MSSDLLDPRLELMAMPPQEEALRRSEQRDATACIARHARDEKDKALLLAALGLADRNRADYWRWQGHAEARRQLSQALGLPVGWPVKDEKQAGAPV